MAIESSTSKTWPKNSTQLIMEGRYVDTQGVAHYRNRTIDSSANVATILAADSIAMAESLAEREAAEILEGED